MPQALHHLMANGEINDKPEYIVECRHEWACSQGRINFETMQRHGYPRAEKARKNDYEEQGNARRNAQGKIHMKEQAYRQYNS